MNTFELEKELQEIYSTLRDYNIKLETAKSTFLEVAEMVEAYTRSVELKEQKLHYIKQNDCPSLVAYEICIGQLKKDRDKLQLCKEGVAKGVSRINTLESKIHELKGKYYHTEKKLNQSRKNIVRFPYEYTKNSPSQQGDSEE